MDPRYAEFVALCDSVLAAARDFRDAVQGSPVLVEYVDQIATAVSELRAKALGQQLPPSGGAAWGMVRFVGEWADDHPLYDACLGLERYYRSNF